MTPEQRQNELKEWGLAFLCIGLYVIAAFGVAWLIGR